MSLPCLSTELILEIAEHLDSQASISALRNTNNRFYSILERTLHRRNIEEHESEALRWACQHDKRQLVAKLLSLGADVRSAPYPYDWCPLKIAISFGRVEIVQMLLAHDPSLINHTDETEETSLLTAVSNHRPEIVEQLLKSPYIHDEVVCEASGLSEVRRTPLSCALLGGSEDIVRILITDPRVQFDRNSLNDAVRGGNSVLVKICMENTRCRFPNQPLDTSLIHVAVEYGHDTVLSFLLAEDIDPDGESGLSYTTYCRCWSFCDYDASEELHGLLCREQNIPQGFEKFLKEEPQLRKRQQHLCATVRWLLRCERTDANLRGFASRSPLSWAAQSHQVQVVRMLLSGGADIHSNDNNGHDALWWSKA